MPDTLPSLHLFSALLDPATPLSHADEPVWLVLAGAVVPLAGLALAWMLWGRPSSVMRGARTAGGPDGRHDVLSRWQDIPDRAGIAAGALMRAASARVFAVRAGFLDMLARWSGRIGRRGARMLERLHNGRMRWYAAWIAGGLCMALAVAVLS